MGEDASAAILAAALVPDPKAAGLRVTKINAGRRHLRHPRYPLSGRFADRGLEQARFDDHAWDPARRDPMLFRHNAGAWPTLLPCRTTPTRLPGRWREVRGELLLTLTASATSGIRDVGPAGVRPAGGALERFGMPIDPGKLLFTRRHRGRVVIGLQGCARSLSLNRWHWVIERVACGSSAADFRPRLGSSGQVHAVAHHASTLIRKRRSESTSSISRRRPAKQLLPILNVRVWDPPFLAASPCGTCASRR